MEENRRRRALVIGGTGLLGSRVCIDLASSGIEVVSVSRGHKTSREAASTAAMSIQQIKADVTKLEEVQALFQHEAEDGNLKYVVYTPGLVPDVEISLARYDPLHWQQTFDTYVTGFFFCFQQCLKLMQPSGHLVAISSAVTRFDMNELPDLYAGHYAAAKAALDELCKWARREAHEQGILLSRIAPAAIASSFHKQAPVSRRPTTMLAVDFVSRLVVTALTSHSEIDQVVLADSRINPAMDALIPHTPV